MQGYRTLLGTAVGEYEEKHSRFIAEIKPVSNEEEALAFIKEQKSKYWDARHNVYAYRLLGDECRFSDDGEPHGTAGKPVLDIITGRQLSNVCIVVTRYFGGILLGTGGLVRAYSEAARNAVDNATIAEMGLIDKFSLHCDYQQYNRLLPFFAKYDVNINDTVFLEDVIINFALSNEKSESFLLALTDNFAGKISAQKEGQIFAPVNIIKNNID
ncbi:MAG: YigZ family protein [Ruminococcaceae bacterium]|nr:YigZ family protein [Oscillospiraceae bacterium]